MKFLGFIGLFLICNVGHAHHYKGLPHYSYFDNYPQVPILEFIKETNTYEVFTTIYNFQGLNLDQVESPDDVRFYIYAYDLIQDKTYLGTANISILSHGKEIFSVKNLKAEQENIFVIQTKIKEQDDLLLAIGLTDSKGVVHTVKMPVAITKGFFEKYGLLASVLAFFLGVMGIKITISKIGSSESKATNVTQPA